MISVQGLGESSGIQVFTKDHGGFSPEEIAERALPFPGLLNAMVHHSGPGASATKFRKQFSMGPDFHNFKSPQELSRVLGAGLFLPFSILSEVRP